MDLLDILLTGASGMSSGGATNLPDMLKNIQQQEMAKQKFQQQLQLLKTKAALQAQDPLRQAQTTKVQASAQPQTSLESLLGGENASQEGSSTFAYGGEGAGLPMEQSNERIRMILDALMAGEAPGAADPLLGEQVRKDFTPVSPTPGQPFRLKGYEQEGFGFDPTTGSFTNIGLPTPEGAVAPTTPTPGKVDPKALSRHAEIVRTLTKNGYSPTQAGSIANQVVPEVAAMEQATKMEERRQEITQQKEIARATAPAPAGVYLDKDGIPYAPLFGEDIKRESGTAVYRQNSPQQKVLTATGMVNAHIDRTLDHLNAIKSIDSNRFMRYMSTALKTFQNDPDIVALQEFLGPASAMAISNAYASSGVSMRGGVSAAKMFEKSVFNPTDNLATVLTKMKDLAKIAEDQAKFMNLHPAIVKAAQDRIDVIDKMLGETGKKKTKTTTETSSNRVPMINPKGQKVTLPAEQVQDALKAGYKAVQP